MMKYFVGVVTHLTCMVFETYLVLDYSLFPFLHTTLNCSLEITDIVTMATNTWTSHTNAESWIFCCVMFAKVSTTIPIKINHHQVRIGMLYSTFLLTAIIIYHISPMQSHSSPKTILIPPEENPKKIWKKINQN